MRILVTGGVKSGKSRYALTIAERLFTEKLFIATAIPFDKEMESRIEKHKAERDNSYTTVEEPVYLDRLTGNNIILDDITVWLANLMYKNMLDNWKEILLGFLSNTGPDAVIITNETGWGNIPPDPETRRYNRTLGEANILLADRCEEVYACMAGIPLRLK